MGVALDFVLRTACYVLGIAFKNAPLSHLSESRKQSDSQHGALSAQHGINDQ